MSRSKFRAIFLLTLLTLAVMVTPAYSTTITTYSSSATWLAATTGVTTDNFTGVGGTSGVFTTTGAITQNGVVFVGLTGSTTGIADTSAFSWANFGTSFAGFVANPGTITITLPTPVTAFSINLFTNPTAVTYTVSTLSTPFTVPTFAVPTPAFFGETSDTPFSTVTLSVPAGTTYAFFDNFAFGAADTSQVPEAGTFLLIGTGLLGFAAIRYKARQPR